MYKFVELGVAGGGKAQIRRIERILCINNKERERIEEDNHPLQRDRPAVDGKTEEKTETRPTRSSQCQRKETNYRPGNCHIRQISHLKD